MGLLGDEVFPRWSGRGLDYLKAVAGPIPELRFCPTGGVSPQNAPDYLAQPNILCVGGSWVTPKALVAAKDWAGITKLAAKPARSSRAALDPPDLRPILTGMVDPAQHFLLHDALSRSRRLVIFTGAGLSTESGVPDFRTPGSPWMANKPIPFEAFVASAAARKEAWRRKFTMDDSFAGAQPSPVHRLLADLVSEGRALGIITQNIDGLHQAAGTPPDKLIELHGNGTYATCLDCGLRHELSVIRERFEVTGLPRSARIARGL